MIGGIENHVFSLYKHVSSDEKYKNYEFMNLSFNPIEDKKIFVNNNFYIISIRTFFLFGNNYPIPTVYSFFKFIVEIIKFKPDLIHTHNRYVISTWIAIFYAYIFKIKTVHTEHAANDNWFENKIVSNFSKMLDKTIARFMLKKVDILTSVSTAVKNYLLNSFGLKSTVIYNFYNADDAYKVKKSISRNNVHNKSSRTSVLFGGRLVSSKGYTLMLDVINRYTKNDLAFMIVGKGSNKVEKEIRSFCKNHKDRVTFYGELNHIEFLKKMVNSDIYLNLSYLEGLSTTIMEAMFFNKKIIATKIEPNRELLRNYKNAILVEHNVESIISAIGKIKNSKLSKPNKDILSLYRIDSIAKQYMKIYKKL